MAFDVIVVGLGLCDSFNVDALVASFDCRRLKSNGVEFIDL